MPARLVLFLAVALLLFAGFMYFAPQTETYLKMRRYTPEPWWRQVPRPLTDTSVSTAPGNTFLYFGYKFETPFANVVKKWTDEYGRRARIEFSTGHEVFFWDPAYSQSDSLPGLGGSKYEHLKSALSVTPDALSPFLTHRAFAIQVERLMEKGHMLEHSGATEIFNLQTSSYRGFEVSGVSYNGRVGIGLFDAADHQFLIEIQQKPGLPVTTTQADINRLIESFASIREELWTEQPQATARFGLYR